MQTNTDTLRTLIVGMRSAYARGENVMAHARAVLGAQANTAEATLVAYDLQAGSYVACAERLPEENECWCRQLAAVVGEGFPKGGSLLEVGSGEATTLAGIARLISPGAAYGLDLSWSRCTAGREWLERSGVEAELLVGDLFSLPFADDSIDVVYTSHSLEPNGGREREALCELLRVARHRLVLCEPAYELAGPEARARMVEHGYVRGLPDVLASLGVRAGDWRLLPYSPNPLNPSGVIVIEKNVTDSVSTSPALRCPLTHTPLVREDDVCLSPLTGLVYPVLRGIPLLRPEHAVVASRLVASPLTASAVEAGSR